MIIVSFLSNSTNILNYSFISSRSQLGYNKPMEIKSTLTNSFGKIVSITYQDVESENDFKDKNISGVHAYCFYKDKLVIVYDESKSRWTPPGGRVEKEETAGDAVKREVQEEINMKVLKQRFIGIQDISEFETMVSQTRSVCIVEPYGDFIKDTDEDITEIKLIDPKDYKQYFDWGEIGDRLMERALQSKVEMELEFNYVV